MQGEGRADRIAAETLQALAVVPVDPDAGVEREAVEEGAAARVREWVLVSRGEGRAARGEEAQAAWEGKDPLPHRHDGEDVRTANSHEATGEDAAV